MLTQRRDESILAHASPSSIAFDGIFAECNWLIFITQRDLERRFWLQLPDALVQGLGCRSHLVRVHQVLLVSSTEHGSVSESLCSLDHRLGLLNQLVGGEAREYSSGKRRWQAVVLLIARLPVETWRPTCCAVSGQPLRRLSLNNEAGWNGKALAWP
jgi:hypothetical protein